jgi:uncharacterized protein (TIGR02391 family)
MNSSHSRRSGLAQLKGLKSATVTSVTSVDDDVAANYNDIVTDLRPFLGPKPEQFLIPPDAFYTGGSGKHRYCKIQAFRTKLEQAIAFLEASDGTDALIVRTGVLFNSISDAELKLRCADLLSASGAFDRAINQATQVLEDRIRRKGGAGNDLTGVELVNRLIKSEPSKSVLVVSSDSREQEGFANVCRGVMQAFRNPTHHEITDRFSREDALKVCAFIDLLLSTLEGAAVQSAAS